MKGRKYNLERHNCKIRPGKRREGWRGWNCLDLVGRSEPRNGRHIKLDSFHQLYQDHHSWESRFGLPASLWKEMKPSTQEWGDVIRSSSCLPLDSWACRLVSEPARRFWIYFLCIFRTEPAIRLGQHSPKPDTNYSFRQNFYRFAHARNTRPQFTNFLIYTHTV